MTLYEFNRLPTENQFQLAFLRGNFLARRWEEAADVNLYHMQGTGRGFFVEVHYDPDGQEVLRARAFNSNAPLEEYAMRVQLPEWQQQKVALLLDRLSVASLQGGA